jgi:hypothetical protein
MSGRSSRTISPKARIDAMAPLSRASRIGLISSSDDARNASRDVGGVAAL